jgi:hypothetical protein
MDYRDELRLCPQQALLQERHSLPQPRTITPIFRGTTPSPGSISPLHDLAREDMISEIGLPLGDLPHHGSRPAAG